MPPGLATVGGRRHPPVNALAVMGLGSIAALWLYTRPDSPFKTLTGIFGFILSFCITSIAAIVLPYRQRKVWEKSSVNWRLGGVPVMSIVGVLSLIAAGFMGWDYLHDPLSGLTWKPSGGGGMRSRRRCTPVPASPGDVVSGAGGATSCTLPPGPGRATRRGG